MIENIFIYFFSSYIFIFVSIKICVKLKILDYPNNRKIHNKPVPLSGGVALIFMIFFFTFFHNLKIEAYTFFIIIFFLSITALFFLGILDDLYNLKPANRIFILITIYLFFLNNELYENEKYFFLLKNIQIVFQDFNIELNFIHSIIFTIFCLLCFQNSINMIDGLNGLSSMILIIINSYILFFSLDSKLVEINICLIIFLITYFIFNMNNRLFFGESGIYLISFITSLLIIFSYQKDLIKIEQILLLLLIPGVDMIRIILLRVRLKQNISKSDNNHLHHLLLKKYSPKEILLIIFMLIVPFNFIGIYIDQYIYMIILFNLLSYLILIKYTNKK